MLVCAKRPMCRKAEVKLRILGRHLVRSTDGARPQHRVQSSYQRRGKIVYRQERVRRRMCSKKGRLETPIVCLRQQKTTAKGAHRILYEGGSAGDSC